MSVEGPQAGSEYRRSSTMGQPTIWHRTQYTGKLCSLVGCGGWHWGGFKWQMLGVREPKRETVRPTEP